MLYSKILIAAITGISCVAAMPADAPKDKEPKKDVEVFRRGRCRDDRDDLYCGRGVNEFVKYAPDVNSKLCYNDGANILFCAIREQQKLAVELAREWQRLQRCGLNQYYAFRERRCECYGRRDAVTATDRCDDDDDFGRDNHYPNCKGDDIAFCAANEDLIITYDRINILCDRNRGNYVFCADPERGAARDKARDHFRDRRNSVNQA
ncbi:EC2 protein [Colletotrichum higginsianum IMI 349063]|uniref:EC2 protein n=2 Tax=Colletotrichum higginsianum TaxID=80884 RepID=A0A1B7Y812_COLHI|nr:EC2 protein [Colletotrichum higginsianum IMI 349063]OBR08201.1 EC2 protein [Colletotrichum higginsianum IMI 349063]GJC97718.1 EC2 protein [Colletotrichum higginsianum]CCF70874.1 EC2 protein [Colletotrichum higginsianum]